MLQLCALRSSKGSRRADRLTALISGSAWLQDLLGCAGLAPQLHSMWARLLNWGVCTVTS